MIAVALERFELPVPIDNSLPHGRPIVALGSFHNILAMAMTDSVLRQKLVAIGIGLFTGRGSISGIPVEHEERRLYRAEDFGSLCTGGSVAGGFILKEQN